MPKAPAFQLYVNDFDSDTAAWDCEEIGIYIRLLFYQWVNGSIPDDPVRLARIARISPKSFLKKWSSIQIKFIPTGTGQLQNLRLEKTRQEQDEFKKHQSESGLRGIAIKKEKGIYPFNKSSDPSSDPSSETQALQSSSSSSKETTTTTKTKENYFLSDADAYRLAELLLSCILEVNPESRLSALNNGGREKRIQSWAKDIDLLLRVDQRDPSTVEEVIQYATHDDFWGPNVMSGSKLREKWDTLVARMDKGKSKVFKHSQGVVDWLAMTEGKDT